MNLSTRLLCTLTVELDEPQVVQRTPAGDRKVVGVRGGSVEGPRLRGRLLPGGADWALVRGDGSLLLDVRLVLETDDGSRVLMTYRGVRHGPPEVLARLGRAEPVDPAEYYFRILVMFETGAPAYDWLNRVVAVGVGERLAAGPRYTVHEVL